MNRRYIAQLTFHASFPCQITFNRGFEYSHERELAHMADFRMVSSSKGARYSPNNQVKRKASNDARLCDIDPTICLLVPIILLF